MSRIDALEKEVHGRTRNLKDENEVRFGVTDDMFYAKNRPPIDGAQWTGIVTEIALAMLRDGAVEAVVCVQSYEGNRCRPKPVVAFTEEDVLKARGVKPSLSPNLDVLATIESLDVKRLLFIGVGCQVQALRSIERYLGLDRLYVLGTNCVDNGHPEGFDKFVNTASQSPETVLHYEFMQDYRVHIKHLDGHFEYIPFFSLPNNDLNDVIAQSCYSCFDYTNALADVVVGYMAVPYQDCNMTEHFQYVTVRNCRGREMLEHIKDRIEKRETETAGKRKSFVIETLESDDKGKHGTARKPLPKWLGNILARILTKIGPRGLEFAKYSIDYHTLRNYLYIHRNWKPARRDEHLPQYTKQVITEYQDVLSRILQQKDKE